MRSILQDEQECWLTRYLYQAHRTDWLERHHVFGGSRRKLSEKYGLTVYLNHFMHNEPPDGVHFNLYHEQILQEHAQRTAMAHYGWSVAEFMQIFDKNYLNESGLDIWPEEGEVC